MISRLVLLATENPAIRFQFNKHDKGRQALRINSLDAPEFELALKDLKIDRSTTCSRPGLLKAPAQYIPLNIINPS